jgi:hypothetical protein
MVVHLWQSENQGDTTVERWQNKIRRLRQYLRGWAKHAAGSLKKEKKKLISMLDAIDKKRFQETAKFIKGGGHKL